MLKEERQAYLLHQVNLHNKVLAVNLSQDISVSNDTIRQDLQELAEEGEIIKVNVGALCKSFHKSDPPSEQVYSYVNKSIIKQKAAGLVKAGMFVLTSGSAAIVEFARTSPKELNATFILGSLSALMEYVNIPP